MYFKIRRITLPNLTISIAGLSEKNIMMGIMIADIFRISIIVNL